MAPKGLLKVTFFEPKRGKVRFRDLERHGRQSKIVEFQATQNPSQKQTGNQDEKRSEPRANMKPKWVTKWRL